MRHEFDENCLAFSFKSNTYRKNISKFDSITTGSGLRHEFNDNYLEQRKHTSKFGSITAEREGLTLKGIETSIRHEIITWPVIGRRHRNRRRQPADPDGGTSHDVAAKISTIADDNNARVRIIERRVCTDAAFLVTCRPAKAVQDYELAAREV